MMIRSMPPASAHLADRPVPAPPPMIGCRPRPGPAAGPARPLDSFRRRRHQLVQTVDHRPGERLVVDVHVELVHLDAAVERFPDAIDERAVGLGVVERLALASIIDTPRSGMNRIVGPRARESLRPILRPSSALPPASCASA